MKRAPKASLLGGVGACSPRKFFIFRALEMPFPIFSREKFNQSLKKR